MNHSAHFTCCLALGVSLALPHAAHVAALTHIAALGGDDGDEGTGSSKKFISTAHSALEIAESRLRARVVHIGRMHDFSNMNPPEPRHVGLALKKRRTSYNR
jgi:hypothetical protein